MIFEGWTDRNVSKLTKAIALGWNATQAGKAIGCSRNAAISKARRLDLRFGESPNSALHSQRCTKAYRDQAKSEKASIATRVHVISSQARNRQLGFGDPSKRSHSRIPPRAPDEHAPAGPIVPLLSLGAHHCRFPIGEPGTDSFGFCGSPKEVNSYCLHHARIAFVNPGSVSDLARSVRRWL